MHIQPVNNYTFAFSGGISSQHAHIIEELLALGIQPSYNYAQDVAKLKIAKSQKMAGTLHKDKIKKETDAKKQTGKNSIQNNAQQNNKEVKISTEIAGAMYVSSLNKLFLVKNKKLKD